MGASLLATVLALLAGASGAPSGGGVSEAVLTVPPRQQAAAEAQDKPDVGVQQAVAAVTPSAVWMEDNAPALPDMTNSSRSGGTPASTTSVAVTASVAASGNATAVEVATADGVTPLPSSPTDAADAVAAEPESGVKAPTVSATAEPPANETAAAPAGAGDAIGSGSANSHLVSSVATPPTPAAANGTVPPTAEGGHGHGPSMPDYLGEEVVAPLGPFAVQKPPEPKKNKYWSEREANVSRYPVEYVMGQRLAKNAPAGEAEMPAAAFSANPPPRPAMWGAAESSWVGDPSSYSPSDVVAHVTVLIKTFERTPCLLNSLRTIQTRYPRINVIVVDDSKEVAETQELMSSVERVRYFPIRFDAGVSAGRNFGVEQVSTPLVLVMDDDQMMTENTRIEELMSDLARHKADIVGGCNEESAASGQQCKGDWDMFLSDKQMTSSSAIPAYHSLHVVPYAHKFMDYVKQRDGSFNQTDLYCKEADMVSSFFLARTSFLREQNRWDPFFKVGEMPDFFYRAKTEVRANIRFCTSSIVLHRSNNCLGTHSLRTRYDRFRDREGTFMEYFFVKHPPISLLKLPLATVRYECGCDEENIDSYLHVENCRVPPLPWKDRVDCGARWDSVDGGGRSGALPQEQEEQAYPYARDAIGAISGRGSMPGAPSRSGTPPALSAMTTAYMEQNNVIGQASHHSGMPATAAAVAASARAGSDTAVLLGEQATWTNIKDGEGESMVGVAFGTVEAGKAPKLQMDSDQWDGQTREDPNM